MISTDSTNRYGTIGENQSFFYLTLFLSPTCIYMYECNSLVWISTTYITSTIPYRNLSFPISFYRPVGFTKYSRFLSFFLTLVPLSSLSFSFFVCPLSPLLVCRAGLIALWNRSIALRSWANLDFGSNGTRWDKERSALSKLTKSRSERSAVERYKDKRAP